MDPILSENLHHEFSDGFPSLWSRIFLPSVNVIEQQQAQRPIERALIVGKEVSGITSIAFCIAYEEACRGGHPLFICRKSDIYGRPPRFVNQSVPCIDPGRDTFHPSFELPNDQYATTSSLHAYRPEILSQINMKYVDSGDNLYKFLAVIQELPVTPTLVVIDNISNLLPSVPNTLLSTTGFNTSGQLLLMGILDDLICHYNQRDRLNPYMRLLITDCHSSIDRNIAANYSRFINTVVDLDISNNTTGKFQLMCRNVGLSL
jgi:hypothetical protein